MIAEKYCINKPTNLNGFPGLNSSSHESGFYDESGIHLGHDFYTVDGSEIQCSPVDMVNITFYRVLYIPGGDRQISEPSTVSCFFRCLDVLIFIRVICPSQPSPHLLQGGPPTSYKWSYGAPMNG